MLSLFVIGAWFGMVVISLVRINADRTACSQCAEIELTNRRGERVLLGADGSRRMA
jgi:hypothetical protein